MPQRPRPNWSIRRKTLAGFATALLVLLSVVAAAYFTTESFRRSVRRIEQSLQIIAIQQGVSAALFELAWNQRTYIVSGKADDLSLRNASLAELQAAMTRLRESAAFMTVEQRQRLRQVEQAIAREIALMDQALSVRQAIRVVAPEQIETMRVQARNELIAARAALTEIDVDEKTRVAQLIAATQRTAALLYTLLASALALFVLVLGWLLWRILADLKIRDAIEYRLQQSNAFLESVVENIPSMVFIKDARDLRFVRFNRAGEQLLGYKRDDLIGKSDRDFFPPQQADFFVAKDREVLIGGAVVDIPEEEIDTLAQGRRILHTRKVPVLDQQGKPAFLLGISLDITEQKTSEREIRKLNEELKQKTEQLTAANRELESFCYSVSHDLRAPLRAIDGYSGMLEQEYRERLGDDALRYLRGVRNNSQRMAELIDDLLEFSRLGRHPLEIAKVDMTAIAKQAAREAVEGLAAPVPAISIQPLLDAQCDPRALHQVWLNLLDNAVKYSSQSTSPSIDVWAERRADEQNDEIVYSVRDNGVGFDMQYHDKLFGVFERLHSSKDYPGTGVGLAIVQRVIARHGGKVWADSSPGHGAVFHFSLPHAAREQNRAA